MFIREDLERAKRSDAAAQKQDTNLHNLARDFIIQSDKHNYAYQWTWLGLPILQMPQDVLAIQEIVWKLKPDVIIETGIAWGGSIVFYASLLELIGKGRVIGIDLNLMEHVSKQIMDYKCSHRINLLKGSSTDPDLVKQVKDQIKPGDTVMVLLDSNHTHEHVLAELRAYGPAVTPGQYLIVSDTYVEDIPVQTHRPRPWGPGANPKTAAQAYLQETDRFSIDEELESKLLLTFMPSGFLRCVK